MGNFMTEDDLLRGDADIDDILFQSPFVEKRLKVGFIDDDKASQVILHKMLDDVADLDCFFTIEELDPNGFDVILMDLNLKDHKGVESVKEYFRVHGDAVPVVVLSSTTDTNTKWDCIETGALDYVEKGGDWNAAFLLDVMRKAVIQKHRKPVTKDRLKILDMVNAWRARLDDT